MTRIEPDRPEPGSAHGLFVLKVGWDAPLTDVEFDEPFGR